MATHLCQTSNFNSPHMRLTEHASLTEEFALLSLAESPLTRTARAILNQIATTQTLTSTFDTLHSRIIADYLGFTSLANIRLAALVDGCRSYIEMSNREKPANAPACVILQTSHDVTGYFTSFAFLPELEQLAKTHYLVLEVIGMQAETFGNTLLKIAERIKGRAIMTLLVRAHGNERGIVLGCDRFYPANAVNEQDFAPLHPKASIILSSCYGSSLAQKIAAVQSRPIFASTGDAFCPFLTPCCSEHGLGLWAVDESENSMIIKRFQKQGAHIVESTPCFATGEKIKEIKKIQRKNVVWAAELGDAAAQFTLGNAYRFGRAVPQSDHQSVEWHEKAAKQDFAAAQHALGIAYDFGRGVPQDAHQAVKWFKKAAKQGFIDAQYSLSISYYTGEGIEQSYSKAVELLQNLAKLGIARAQCNLGVAYSNGHGVPQSDHIAVEWFQKAAEQGLAVSQYNLGSAYEAGTGIPQSIEAAIKWYRLAAAQGFQAAKSALSTISSANNT